MSSEKAAKPPAVAPAVSPGTPLVKPVADVLPGRAAPVRPGKADEAHDRIKAREREKREKAERENAAQDKHPARAAVQRAAGTGAGTEADIRKLSPEDEQRMRERLLERFPILTGQVPARDEPDGTR